MATGIQLRPQEQVLFDGEVEYFRGQMTGTASQALITQERLALTGGNEVYERADVADVVEGKHGLVKTMVFTLRDGDRISLATPNYAMLRAAGLILAGKAPISALPKQPALSKVKNGTLWLAALGPVWAGMIVLVLGLAFWGNLDEWRASHVVQGAVARVVLMYVFLRIDYQSLQRQGYDVKKLGVKDPITLPLYLFSRAKAFGRGSALAVIWSLLFAADLAGVLL